MRERFLAAFRTNKPQVTHVLMFTLLNLAACQGHGEWWMWLVAIGFWPTMAFFANLADPIPKS